MAVFRDWRRKGFAWRQVLVGMLHVATKLPPGGGQVMALAYFTAEIEATDLNDLEPDGFDVASGLEVWLRERCGRLSA
ncbi:MAG: hypothetical protein JWQ97_2601 [Phenylobacterium sp.]|nr:hypothetical protein [Phenylobacterium sp.]